MVGWLKASHTANGWLVGLQLQRKRTVSFRHLTDPTQIITASDENFFSFPLRDDTHTTYPILQIKYRERGREQASKTRRPDSRIGWCILPIHHFIIHHSTTNGSSSLSIIRVILQTQLRKPSDGSGQTNISSCAKLYCSHIKTTWMKRCQITSSVTMDLI